MCSCARLRREAPGLPLVLPLLPSLWTKTKGFRLDQEFLRRVHKPPQIICIYAKAILEGRAKAFISVPKV